MLEALTGAGDRGKAYAKVRPCWGSWSALLSRVSVLIAGFLLLVASCVLTPTAAYALDCSAQQQIFTVADPSGFTSLGGQARIRRAENVIESSCSQDWNINTVNFQFSITTRAYYEVGIYEFSDGSQGDNPPHAMRIFTEYTVGSYVDFETWPGLCYPLYADDDQYLRFRIVTGSGGSHWSAKLDCLDGNGYQLIETQNSTGYYAGRSRGEWERFPDTNTFNTRHDLLKWRGVSLNWFPWEDVLCHGDTTPGVELNVLSSTSWNLVAGNGGC
jgi:hypothetical protein